MTPADRQLGWAQSRHAAHVRVKAAQAAHDHFVGKPFVWGRYDCARMAAFAIRHLGHKPGLLRFGAYKTEIAATKALLRLGYRSLAEAVDALDLPRIPPAMALPGDLISLDADTPLGALTVALGNGRVLGWHEDAPGCGVLQPTVFGVAWRA